MTMESADPLSFLQLETDLGIGKLYTQYLGDLVMGLTLAINHHFFHLAEIYIGLH